MDITPYVDRLRHDLVAAAEAGDPEVRAAAERLGHALDASARLALMEAVSDAAAEITAEMPRGGVDVRLDGRDLAFVVDAAPAPVDAAAPAAGPAALPAALPAAHAVVDDPDDGTLARITLRLPEAVKARAEERAARSGSSLNTWLVSVLRAATADAPVDVDVDLSAIPFFGAGRGAGRRRMTGWV